MLRTKQYTKEQRVFMVSNRTRGDSYKAINYDFQKAFPLSGRNPDRRTIYKINKKFEKEGKLVSGILHKIFNFTRIFDLIDIFFILGTVLNLNPGRSGRKRSALKPAHLQMLEDLIDGKYI